MFLPVNSCSDPAGAPIQYMSSSSSRIYGIKDKFVANV